MSGILLLNCMLFVFKYLFCICYLIHLKNLFKIIVCIFSLFCLYICHIKAVILSIFIFSLQGIRIQWHAYRYKFASKQPVRQAEGGRAKACRSRLQMEIEMEMVMSTSQQLRAALACLVLAPPSASATVSWSPLRLHSSNWTILFLFIFGCCSATHFTHFAHLHFLFPIFHFPFTHFPSKCCARQ